MNFTQKSRHGLHTKVVNGQWTPHGGDDDSADTLYGGMGADVIYGGERLITTNSIAYYADNTPAKCLKGFKNRRKTSLKRCINRKYE